MSPNTSPSFKNPHQVKTDFNMTKCQLCKRLAGPVIPLSWSSVVWKGFHLGCDHYGAVKNHILCIRPFSAWHQPTKRTTGWSYCKITHDQCEWAVFCNCRHWYFLHWTKTKVLRSFEWYSICITHVVHFQKKIGAFSSFFFQSLHARIPAALSTQEQSLFQVSENQARTTSGSSCFSAPRCRWSPQSMAIWVPPSYTPYTISNRWPRPTLSSLHSAPCFLM